MNKTEITSPCLVAIFGASGDLTKRKLIPALYEQHVMGHLPDDFAVMGISRTQMTDEVFREHLKPWVKKSSRFDQAKWDQFSACIYYLPADSTLIEDFASIKQRINQLSVKHRTGENLLFYLSMAPHLYEPTVINIGAAKMVTEGKSWCCLVRDSRPWQRIIVEKPFGHDPDSAAHLNRVLGRVFEEESIYRIDHYLGKEIVQNMLVFRFANAIFEPIWNSNYISHVQVTANETVGVEKRGGYYDSPGGGAMRDMIQSHLLQVMALVAMEPPVSMHADHIRSEKAKVFQATRGPMGEDVAKLAVKGQYGPGSLNGKAVVGYRQEKGVMPESQTETYAAMQLYIDTWRWGGVPFFIRSGKRMAKKTTEIVINFKPTPHILFKQQAKHCKCNQIVINVQPNEGIRLRFEGKVPGSKMDIKDVEMEFDYIEQFNADPPDAYATLLLDAIQGDQTLFKHREEIESCWRIVQPTLDYWRDNPQDDFPNYASGTSGPSASDIMLAKVGGHWHS